MDVGKEEHRALLNKLHLLFGVVTYSAGKLGQEPVRSQGHIHKISPYSGWSTPEIYEIWSGEAIIYNAGVCGGSAVDVMRYMPFRGM